MIALRLMRLGAKKKPFYRIVAVDSRRPRESKVKDVLGTYDPLKEPSEITMDLEKVKEWISKGAQPSKTVQSLIQRISQSAKESA